MVSELEALLQNLERLEREATQGAWSAFSHGGAHYIDVKTTKAAGTVARCFKRETDTHFIAAARNAIPVLIPYVRALEKLRASLTSLVASEVAKAAVARRALNLATTPEWVAVLQALAEVKALEDR